MYKYFEKENAVIFFLDKAFKREKKWIKRLVTYPLIIT